MDCSCQVPFADLHEASEALIKALLIRAKYMAASQQSFPDYDESILAQCVRSCPGVHQRNGGHRAPENEKPSRVS